MNQPPMAKPAPNRDLHRRSNGRFLAARYIHIIQSTAIEMNTRK